MLIMNNSKVEHLLLTIILCFSANLLAQEKSASQLVAIPGGSVSSSPAPQEPVTQSPKTSMDLTWFNKTRTVQSSDNWSVGSIATALKAGVQATVTLPVGPVGIDTGGTARFGGPRGQYQIRITDGANS